jgi:hypothetical protein
MSLIFGKEIYYDDKNIIKCPYCNIIIFYIYNSWEHECFMKNNEKFIINEKVVKNKVNEANEFFCNIEKINDKCIKHNNEFCYYKNSKYYCNECLMEKNLNDFIILEKITISKEELNDFFDLIKKFENILSEIKKINEDLILNTDRNFKEELKKSYKNFEERNILLINFCKGLIKFNEKYEKNFNLISTIRRISIDFDMNKLKNKNNNELIDYYNDNNIINFNNDLNYYFSSENILQNGKYYLGNIIGGGTFGYVY